MTTPDALAAHLRMVADLVETAAKVVGDARPRDVPGLFDGFDEGRSVLGHAGPLADAMRGLAGWIERPSPMAKRFARERGEETRNEER